MSEIRVLLLYRCKYESSEADDWHYLAGRTIEDALALAISTAGDQFDEVTSVELVSGVFMREGEE